MTTDHSPIDVALVIRVPRELRDALKARAAEEDRSVASMLRLAARNYLDGDGNA